LRQIAHRVALIGAGCHAERLLISDELIDRQNGNLFSLAAAYNAGPGNLSKWMALHEGINDPLLFIETVPAAETRNYIKRVMVNLWMYRKRLGEPLDGLDDAAQGRWPVYVRAMGTAEAE